MCSAGESVLLKTVAGWFLEYCPTHMMVSKLLCYSPLAADQECVTVLFYISQLMRKASRKLSSGSGQPPRAARPALQEGAPVLNGDAPFPAFGQSAQRVLPYWQTPIERGVQSGRT